MTIYQNPSMTTQGKNEEFYLQVARRHISNHEPKVQSGAVPAMSQNQTGSVWDVNDTIYPWATWATAGVVTIPAVNASDNGHYALIYGLDADYNEINETVQLSSSASVVTTKSFKRINSAVYVDGIPYNTGDIEVRRGGASGTIVAKILAGAGQTQMANYTIPAGKTGYILKGACSCQAGADTTGFMMVRPGGDTVFRASHTFEVSGNGGAYIYEFAVPQAIPEKSDIDVRSTVRSNNARVTATYELILIDN